MRRRPRSSQRPSYTPVKPLLSKSGNLAVVLSGGGSRAAYQVGALKALEPLLSDEDHPVGVVIGSSIGAINGLVFSACLSHGLSHTIEQLEELWRERTFKNTFAGSPSRAFLRSIVVASAQLRSPGPHSKGAFVFDPTPLRDRLDWVIAEHGGLTPEERDQDLAAVGVMTTVEGTQRRPLLFLSSYKRLPEERSVGMSYDICYVQDIGAKHGFASAALPSILPPVDLDTEHGKVRLVDGGISQNLPVDPAVRLGAEKVLLVDVSGRDWWCDRYGNPHDKRPTWEVEATPETFCLRPPETLISRCQRPLGPLLREAVGSSTKKFIAALGPVWPLFTLLRKKLGEEVAYETMTYVALDQDYLTAIMERGYHETNLIVKRKMTEAALQHEGVVAG